MPPVGQGSGNAMAPAADGAVSHVVARDPRFLSGRHSLRLGFQAPILQGDQVTARALYEPFLEVEEGRLIGIGGRATYSIPLERC